MPEKSIPRKTTHRFIEKADDAEILDNQYLTALKIRLGRVNSPFNVIEV